MVTQYALAYPQVRFTLTRDGREVFHTNGSDHLPGAVNFPVLSDEERERQIF